MDLIKNIDLASSISSAVPVGFSLKQKQDMEAAASAYVANLGNLDSMLAPLVTQELVGYQSHP